MSGKENLSEAALPDDLEEVEVGGLGGGVRGGAQVDLLRGAGLESKEKRGEKTSDQATDRRLSVMRHI